MSEWKNRIRVRRIEVELTRLEADVHDGVVVTYSDLGVLAVGPGDVAITVDALAAWDALIELVDGAGVDATWSALIALPRAA